MYLFNLFKILVQYNDIDLFVEKYKAAEFLRKLPRKLEATKNIINIFYLNISF